MHRRSRQIGSVTMAAGIVLASGISPAAEPPDLKRVQIIGLKGRAGNLDYMALDAETGRLFLANKANNTLDVVDVKAGKLLKRIPGQQGVQGIAYAADLGRIYAALGAGGFLNVFDSKDYKLLKTVKFKDDADNVRYNPRTHFIYVAHAEKALGVVDARSYEVRADLTLPEAAEAFQLESGRPRLYANVPSPSQVVVIDTEKNAVAVSYPLKLAGANIAMALDEANHRLFLGCRKGPMVVVMDSESGKEIASVPIPADVDDVVFDARQKRLYASCGAGSLAVIQQTGADNYKSLGDVATAKGAKTCVLDADSGRLYLAVPRQEGKEGPEIWVYQTRP